MQQTCCKRVLWGGAWARLRVLPRGHGQLPVIAPVFQFTLLLQRCPVSYTHLDVYKRQSQRNQRMRAVSEFLRQRIGGAQGIVFAFDKQSGQSLRFVG